MAKTNRPAASNPLANIGLDDIVRGITAPEVETPAEETEEPKKKSKPRRGSAKAFDEYLAKYTGISEQGVAIWLPREVKKRLELIRVNASRNIPVRSLAAAIVMAYIDENEDRLAEL